MMGSMKQFWDDEVGAELVEWAVLTLILLVATVPGLLLIRETLIDVIKDIFSRVQENPDNAWVSGGGAPPAPTPTP